MLKWRPGLTARSVLILLATVLVLQIIWAVVFVAGRLHVQKNNSIGHILREVSKTASDIFGHDAHEAEEEAAEHSNYFINYQYFGPDQEPKIGWVNPHLSKSMKRMLDRRNQVSGLDQVQVNTRKGDERFFQPGFHFPHGPRARLSRALSVASQLNVLLILDDGRKLVVEIKPRRGFYGVGGLVFMLIFSVAVLTLVALWVVRRVTKPLMSFAEAATALGENINQKPLEKSGIKEIDTTVDAFNSMQTSVKELLDSRTLMIGAMSHDVRTLLTRLRLRTEFIDDEKQRTKAESDIIEMEQILSSSLEFSASSDFGLNNDNSELLDLVPMLTVLCDDLAENGKIVEVDVPLGQTFVVQGDAMLLKRVFENLLNNALKFGSRAKLSIAHNHIVVEDDGPGIAADEQEKVFRPYYRVEASRNRETGGTGLGLAIAQNIIHGHGGTIELGRSQLGGLKVTVSLPQKGS